MLIEGCWAAANAQKSVKRRNILGDCGDTAEAVAHAKLAAPSNIRLAREVFEPNAAGVVRLICSAMGVRQAAVCQGLVAPTDCGRDTHGEHTPQLPVKRVSRGATLLSSHH